jgi:hypothetical protein
MKLRIFFFFAVILASVGGSSQVPGPMYTPEDSIKIEQLLQKASQQPKDVNIVLFFGKQFVGLPYGAATLEKSDTERLIINLNQLDCTTFVETVTALTLCHRNKKHRFADYCQALKTIRYQGGVLDKYPSRNHYFSTWIESNERLGIVTEIGPAGHSKISPFTAVQQLNIHFMTKHSELYPALVNHPEFLIPIGEAEKSLTGKNIRYIPKQALGGPKYLLGKAIHDGDILALVTQKDGLDVSHLGLAVWMNDGKLHLLHASSLRHKVIFDDLTLEEYQQKQRTQTGVRVIRINKGQNAFK